MRSFTVQNEHEQRNIWEFYQKEKVDSFSGAAPRLEGLVRAVFRLARRRGIKNPAVLNIGVGNGYLEELILNGGGIAYSVDPDERALVRLTEKGVKCHVGRIEQLPIADNTLDFVVVSEVLEHLDDAERGKGLAEIRRVLKRGGFIIGTVPYRETLEQNVTICPHCGEVFHRWGHKKAFELADIRKELSPHFHVERVTRTAFVSLSRGSMLGSLKSLLRFVLAKFGEAIAMPSISFVGRKD
jgi:SAM-dependent methyltransferase